MEDFTNWLAAISTTIVGVGGLYVTWRSGRATERKDHKQEWTAELVRLRTSLEERDAEVRELLDRISALHSELLDRNITISQQQIALNKFQAEVDGLKAQLAATP